MFKGNLVVLVICLLSILLVFSSCASNSSAAAKGEPDWVRDPYTKYDKQANVAMVGSGNSRDAAEKNALGKLVAFFGQSIQVDEKLSTFFQQAERDGVIASWSETTAADTIITTSAEMDSLVGAEIGDIWNNKGEYYAVAVLNKAKASQVYSGIVRSNLAIISNLVAISPSEENTFDAIARYQFAAMLADITLSYTNLLSVIGAPVPQIKKGGEYRLLAQNVTKAIPIGINVRNDKSGIIGGALAGSLSTLGFLSGGSNSRYLLDVNVVAEPVTIAGNQNSWTRIEVSANLRDTHSNTVLLPFVFNSREGHTSQSEADNRAYAAAERKINAEYADLLTGYLNQLVPKK